MVRTVQHGFGEWYIAFWFAILAVCRFVWGWAFGRDRIEAVNEWGSEASCQAKDHSLGCRCESWRLHLCITSLELSQSF